MKFSPSGKSRSRRGFTLVELLVVIAIILLVTAGTIAAVMPMLSQRQITEGARSLQAGLVGARDAAIRTNKPSGIRFLPSTTLTLPAMGSGDPPGTQQLAYDRWIDIEPAGDYTEGKVAISMFDPGNTLEYIAPYVWNTGTIYPCGYNISDGSTVVGSVLRVEEYAYTEDPISGNWYPNNPTSWWWNIRLGDKLRFGNAGPTYTVVGPCTVNPSSSGGANPELYVNDGVPGTQSQLQRTYGTGTPPLTANVEFLYLVNNIDDKSVNLDPVPDPNNAGNFVTYYFSRTDGYVNDGWDGLNNNYMNGVDEANLINDGTNPPHYGEWEDETWQGSVAAGLTRAKPIPDLNYVIERRPVPKRNAKEVKLPGGVVIDATTWNTTQERSRLNFDQACLNYDFMVNADGQVVPQSIYGQQSSFVQPFLHFWLTDSQDVVPREPQAGVLYELPMLKDTLFYPAAGDKLNRFLKGERRLVTVFAKSGLVISGNVESATLLDDTPNPHIYSSGFIGYDQIAIGATIKTIPGSTRPFLDAQNGFQSAK